MLHGLLDTVVSWSQSDYAMIILFIMAFAESSFFPVPPDVLMIPMALANPAFALIYATITTLGSVLGGIFGYIIGDKGGKKVLHKLVSQEKIEMVKYYYHKYDVWAIAVAALTPIPYKLFTISAGTFSLNFKRFVIASVFGRGGRFYLVGFLIFLFGDTVRHFLENYFEIAIVIFTVLLIGGFWFINYISKKFKPQKIIK